MLESAKDSLELDSNLDIDSLLKEDKDLEEMENTVAELLIPEYHDDITYLPDQPVISKFRGILRKGINQYISENKSNINVGKFLTEFNTTLLDKLEKERNSNKDLEKLLHKWKVNSDFHNLLIYVENAKNLFSNPNKVDGRSLSDYYVENKAYVVDKDTWSEDESEIK